MTRRAPDLVSRHLELPVQSSSPLADRTPVLLTIEVLPCVRCPDQLCAESELTPPRDRECPFVAHGAAMGRLPLSEPAGSKRKPGTTPATSSRRLGLREITSLSQ